MRNSTLVKISNTIGIVSILLLVYWVFIFISIEVFGFKIFRENLTETFYMSILGILALMFGALIINVMFNLTRIAERNASEEPQTKPSRIRNWALIGSFPIIFILLYVGDYLSSQQKEKYLVSSAESIINKNESYSLTLANYSFSEKYIFDTSKILEILTETDENFPTVNVIVSDTIKSNRVYLSFAGNYPGNLKDTVGAPPKRHYIEQTSEPEREYLKSVFELKNREYRYSANDGNYELFYPMVKNGKVVILFFSDRQRYGKIGS